MVGQNSSWLGMCPADYTDHRLCRTLAIVQLRLRLRLRAELRAMRVGLLWSGLRLRAAHPFAIDSADAAALLLFLRRLLRIGRLWMRYFPPAAMGRWPLQVR